MPPRKHRPDLKTEVDHMDQTLIFDAEWRPEWGTNGAWVCDDERWKIRLVPLPTGSLDVSNSFLFESQKEVKQLYKRVLYAFVSEARKTLPDHS